MDQSDATQDGRRVDSDDDLSAVCNRLERPLLRYAQSLLGNRETAREVVQDTLLKACRTDLPSLNGRLDAWLFTVCRNRALDVRRKERRMNTLSEPLREQQVATTPPPDQQVEAKEDYHAALAAIDKLPENQREVIRLKFQGQLSYQEIADVTGLSRSNVGYLIHVGLKKLRAEYGLTRPAFCRASQANVSQPDEQTGIA